MAEPLWPLQKPINELVDELGPGIPLFEPGSAATRRFKLETSRSFGSGVVKTTYESIAEQGIVA